MITTLLTYPGTCCLTASSETARPIYSLSDGYRLLVGAGPGAKPGIGAGACGLKGSNKRVVKVSCQRSGLCEVYSTVCDTILLQFIDTYYSLTG